MAATLQIPSNPLGAGGPRVARVALGCGNFGGVGSAPAFFGQGLSHAEALELMDAAWTLGIRHFDTADAYGGGRSEEAIGAWIRSRRTRPSLTTKTFNRMTEDGDQGLSPERIRRQFASSLARLGVDRVDLYLAHEFDRSVPLPETMATFDELREAGQVVSYGVSNFDALQLQQALDIGGCAAVQNGYSLLQRDDETGVIPLCARSGIGYIVFSPLCGGWLTGKYRRGSAYPFGSRMTQRPEPYEALATDETFDRLEWLERFCTERGASMAGTALAWLLADERITQVVVGPGRPEHLQPVREAIERPLTPDERQAVSDTFA
ncbi:MAG TPA: aldo/keto reductase [Solirubrobacteraceae bacterium]|jgi:aryl-alcohol dehydrogenase-like predicted oxidoreductase|nr:aldo/keto reductase [Solirubrobacteraceae bacterium]